MNWFLPLIIKDLFLHYFICSSNQTRKLFPEGKGANNGELFDTAPSQIRKAFYNRLISKDVKEIYRRYLQGHTLGVQSHYFSWEAQKKDILLQYVRANFDRKENGVSQAIDKLREEKDLEIEQLKRQLEQQKNYVKSEEFTKAIVTKVLESKDINFDILDKEPPKTIEVKIPIDSGKELAILLQQGYEIKSRNNQYFVLEKEIE